MRLQGFVAALFLTLLLGWQALPAAAQSLTTGDISVVVSDASGAVVPNATATLTNRETGAAA
jgi:hypothetical protein